MVSVKVPASSANVGAGFDSLGIAVSLYSIIEMEEAEDGLNIKNIDAGCYIPADEHNLVYRAAMQVFEKTGYSVRGIRIRQKSDIPPTRGLGSSSACIIGGMLAANVLSGRQLSYREILDLACTMEGHPDNVTPALYGGVCVCAADDGHVSFKSVKIKPDICFAAHIPDYFVATKKSRTLLPEMYHKKDAVYNISHAALTFAAFASGDTELLGNAVKDAMHQSYRSEYVEGYDDIFRAAERSGAVCTYLSGSGPTLISVIHADNKRFAPEMERFYREQGLNIKCSVLGVDNVGAVVRQSKKSVFPGIV